MSANFTASTFAYAATLRLGAVEDRIGEAEGGPKPPYLFHLVDNGLSSLRFPEHPFQAHSVE
ncbi:hypothetical protein BN2475_90076 [Paraburkholderia ribeironis]|uniref:Uncharacterized protein n=1 Tax=Paraburkholderia ribeironis TaxID=1247936 RepID=A0A1N7RPB3_9BURK|nr:hypothetical protein BN2475_90076 [Paraburkholderia ribeironis]